MKTNTIIVAILIVFSMNAISQTLYVPSGTSGIGSSSTNNIGIVTNTPGAKLSFANLNDGRNTEDGITWYSPNPLLYGIYRTSGAGSKIVLKPGLKLMSEDTTTLTLMVPG